MQLKLGELLLQEKMITAAQLEEALKVHLAFGIKLGSCLLEMGYVKEEPLAQLLSEKLGVPRVGRKEVTAAPWQAISKLSRELAVKYRVIPFRLEDNRLSIAMSAPSNFQDIDEIGFITGCVVKPYIAPDIVIAKALAKFYQTSNEADRYYKIAQYVEKPHKPEKPQTVTFTMKSESGEFQEITVPAEFEGFGGLANDAEDLSQQEPATHAAFRSRQAAQSPTQQSSTFFSGNNYEFNALFNILERKGFITKEEMMEELIKELRKLKIEP